MSDQHSSNELELKKLEAENAFRQQELQLRKHELELQRKQHNADKWKNPVLVAGIAAVIGLFGNIYTNIKQGANDLILEKQKLESSIILRALQAEDAETAKQNLLGFIEIGLLDDEDGLLKDIANNPRTELLHFDPAVHLPMSGKDFISILEEQDALRR